MMDILAKAPPMRVQKDQLHATLNRRVLTKSRCKWDDVTRGMFIALLRQSTRTVPSRTFPVECTIDGLRTIDIAVFKVVSQMMKGHDGFAEFDEYMALEKWAWLCTIYAKAKAVNKVGNPMVWRYSNSMDFLGDETSTTQPFVDLLTTDTFVMLCIAFDHDDNDKMIIAAFNSLAEHSSRRKTRRSIDCVVAAIKSEIEPPTKVQILEGAPSPSSVFPSMPSTSMEGGSNTRMTTRALARTSLASSTTLMGAFEVKQEELEEGEMRMVKEEKFERGEVEEEEMDFTESGANGPTWTKEMVDQVVEEVKQRHHCWDINHPDYRSTTKKRDAMTAVAGAINTTHGTTLTDKDLTVKWNHMRESFGKLVKKYSTSMVRPKGHFFEQMSFMLVSHQNGGDIHAPSPAGSEERNTTPTVTITEGPSQPLNLQQILKGFNGDTPTSTTLKQILEAGLLPLPTAAPQTNGHAHTNGFRNNSQQLLKERESRRLDKEISFLAGNAGNDSWGIFGRLVETSGRELNKASPSLAIKMQRALHEVMHDYRLEAANMGLKL